MEENMDMSKKAFGLNTVFGAMEVVDGAKKMKNTYNNPNNKYDNVLDTKIVKDKNIMGSNNANISKKIASEDLDILYKQAMRFNGAAIKKNVSKFGKKIDDLDVKNTQHIRNMVSGIKSKNINQAFKEGLHAAKVTVPAGAAMVGSGVGLTKGLKKMDKNRTPEKDVEYNTIGAGLTAGLALSALATKGALKPALTTAKVLKKQVMKYPVKVVKDNSKAAKFVINTASGGAKAVNKLSKEQKKMVDGAGKIIYKNMYPANPKFKGVGVSDAVKNYMTGQFDDFVATMHGAGASKAEIDKAWIEKEGQLKMIVDLALKQMGISKKASQEIDGLYKIAGAKTDYAKKLFLDNFLKRGLESIPYYAAPAALSYALNRDLSHGFRKVRDNDNDMKEKVAFNLPHPNVNTEGIKRVAKVSLEKGVEGLGRTIIPATVTAMTGRSLTNAFEKLDNNNARTRQEDMANKIIIQISGNPSKKELKKEINKKVNIALENQEKKASEESVDISNVIQEIQKEIDEITGHKKIDKRTTRLGNGVKKKFRMQE